MIEKSQEEIINTWKGDISKPIVSIRCMTYNHEKYIGDALDSFLMQETTFPFEIVVHDDASTDGTKTIIEKYYKKYPKIIIPLFEKENQYSKGKKHLLTITETYLRGKYVAFCEGDDYWIDNLKLQKQYEGLENNSNSYLCVHKTKIINDTTESSCLPITDFDAGIISTDIFLDAMYIYNFHTSSFFFNKEKLLNFYSQNLPFNNVATVGDIPLMLYFGYIGDVYYIPDFMSVYRKNSESSWTVKNRQNKETYVKSANSMIEMMKKFNDFSNGKYEGMCNKYINNWEFGIYFRTNNYKKLIEKKFEGKRRLLSYSRRLVIYVGIVFPKIADYIVYLHDKKNYTE